MGVGEGRERGEKESRMREWGGERIGDETR